MKVRRIVVAAAVAFPFSLAPAASGSIWPAPALGPAVRSPAPVALRVPHGRVGTTTRACMMSSRAARWLIPVACEHAPRSESLIVPLLGG